MSFVARTKDDLHSLLRPEGIMHPFRKPQVLICMPQMAASEAKAWESRLESLRQQCGCSAGALAFCGFVFSFLIVSAHNNLLATGHPPLREFFAVGVVFLSGLILSALAGKFLGLTVARVRYRRTCFDLQERLRQLEASPAAHQESNFLSVPPVKVRIGS